MRLKLIAFPFSLLDVCKRIAIFTKHTDSTQLSLRTMRGFRLLSDTAVYDVFIINLLDANFLEQKLGQSSNYELQTTLRTRVSRHRAHIIYFYHTKSTQCQN